MTTLIFSALRGAKERYTPEVKKKKKKKIHIDIGNQRHLKVLLYKLLEPTVSYLFGIMKFFTKYLPITNNFMELLFDVSKTFLVIRNTPLLPR